MSGASIDTTLELWASSLRDVKARMRSLLKPERMAVSAGLFLDGLLGEERRKTGWMRAEAAGDPGPWRQQSVLGRGQWDADALRDSCGSMWSRRCVTRRWCWSSARPDSQAGASVVRGRTEIHGIGGHDHQLSARAAVARQHAPEGAPRRGEPAQKGAAPRCIGRPRGGLNSKLHAVCGGRGRPIMLLLSEGQMSDHKGAAMQLPAMPSARHLLADRGYDSDWFRAGLIGREITPCIPPIKSREVALPYDGALYRQRHRIENAFGRLKDWRRIATRHDRCPEIFFSALVIAATVIFWLAR